MPVTAKNHSRREQANKAAAAKSQSDALAKMASAQTEEEKMMAMFAAQGEQWKTQQEEMSHQTPVFRPGAKKAANVPDHEPPNGYVCHRCGEKGHWIQQCPTNDNPEYNDRPRIKRTTGIPKSFLKTVDKATVLAQGNDEGDGSKPSGVMVTADGEFVVHEPDKKAWEKFKAKAQGSEEAKKLAAQDEKELRERGLECELDKKMFIDPMKTPCCAKTYCNDCITNALIEGDLVCPSCQTEGVLIDDLKPDDEAKDKIEEYLREREAARKERSKSPEDKKSPAAEAIKEEAVEAAEVKSEAKDNKSEKPKSPTPAAITTADASVKSPPTEKEGSSTPSNGEASNKKRPAEDAAENPLAKAPKGPKAMRAQEAAQQQQQQQMGTMPDFMGMNGGMNGMNGMNGFGPMGMMGMPPMGMMNPMMGMNPGMMGGFGGFGGMGMNPMMNPMMMNGGFNNGGGMNGGGMNGGFNNHNNRNPNGGGFGGPQMNNHANNAGGGVAAGGFNRGIPSGPRQSNFNNHHHHNNNPPPHQPNMNMNNMNMNNMGMSMNMTGDEDAYFRKPVNPHRHQNRQRRVRPSDYREL